MNVGILISAISAIVFISTMVVAYSGEMEYANFLLLSSIWLRLAGMND